MNLLFHPLTLVTFLPLVGVLVIALLSERQRAAIRWVALITSLATFGVALWVLSLFSVGTADMQLEVNAPWLRFGAFQVGYHLGIDGVSLLMVLLTTFLTPIALLSTWTSVTDRVKGFMLFFLLLEVGMTGVFLALDLVLFYVFWEFTLVPMYFLIGIWGGERRVYAAVKFFLFTMSGSLLMLLAILYMGFTAGTFDWNELLAQRAAFAGAGLWLFLAFAAAFAIKVPMWPLHTWLPDAHVEAPTAGSVILAGVMLKMGAYGFLRFNLALFPEIAVQAAPWMALLAVVGIIYGAAVSYMQRDMKKLVAYSSVSHLGFVVLGLFALNQQGISGGVLQMVNHGLSTGALFLVVACSTSARTRAKWLPTAAFGRLFPSWARSCWWWCSLPPACRASTALWASSPSCSARTDRRSSAAPGSRWRPQWASSWPRFTCSCCMKKSSSARCAMKSAASWWRLTRANW